MELIIDPRGSTRCVYDETLPLAALGRLQLRRASHVEPDETGQWWVDLGPVHGPRLGPFAVRSEALVAERSWLESHWLPQSPSS